MQAKALLKKKGVHIIDIPAWTDKARRTEMNERSGGRDTFPQIFINGEHIGGYDDLRELDEQGGLARFLTT